MDKSTALYPVVLCLIPGSSSLSDETPLCSGKINLKKIEKKSKDNKKNINILGLKAFRHWVSCERTVLAEFFFKLSWCFVKV